MRAKGNPYIAIHAKYCTPIQYCCRVFAIVYRCRREGQLLDREAIAADPARGELRVQRKGMKRVAVLLGADGERYVLPLLDKVRLLALNERGVLLAGIEVFPPRGSKGTGPMYPQTWWCVLKGGPERTEALNGAPKDAIASRCCFCAAAPSGVGRVRRSPAASRLLRDGAAGCGSITVAPLRNLPQPRVEGPEPKPRDDFCAR